MLLFFSGFQLLLKLDFVTVVPRKEYTDIVKFIITELYIHKLKIFSVVASVGPLTMNH